MNDQPKVALGLRIYTEKVRDRLCVLYCFNKYTSIDLDFNHDWARQVLLAAREVCQSGFATNDQLVTLQKHIDSRQPLFYALSSRGLERLACYLTDKSYELGFTKHFVVDSKTKEVRHVPRRKQ